MMIDKTSWKKCKMSEVGQIVSGATPRTNNPKNWENGIYNWVTPAELNGSKFYGETKKKITDKALQETKLTLLPIGTVLLSSRAPIGKVAITSETMYCNQGFKNIICGNELFNEFLYYYLLYNNEELNRRGNGVTFKEISKKIVEAFPIILPPIPVQKSIAAELDSIQGMIAKYREQLEDYDKLAQSIFYEMFGDPVKNEKGWKILPLNQIVHKDCSVSYGIVQPGDDVENGIPIVRPVDLTSTFVSSKGLKKVSKEISDSYKRTILKGGEILMCVRGTTGLVSVASNDLIGCNVTRGIVPLFFESADVWYMFHCIRTSQINSVIQEYTKGATLKQINISDLRNLRFPLPPLQLQQAFASRIEKIEEMKEQVKSQLADLQQLFDSRMQYYLK